MASEGLWDSLQELWGWQEAEKRTSLSSSCFVQLLYSPLALYQSVEGSRKGLLLRTPQIRLQVAVLSGLRAVR